MQVIQIDENNYVKKNLIQEQIIYNFVILLHVI